MNQYLLALLFPIISYFLQVFPRFFNKYFGVDVWTLLIEAKLVRKNKHRIPKGKISEGFIFEGYFDYPPIFLIMLSFFSPKMLFKLQGFIAPFFDALQNIVVFFIAYSLTQDLRIALLAQAIYTFTPVSALENSALTPRSFGYMLFTLAFYFLVLYRNADPTSQVYLLVGFIFTTIVLLSHKFATQSLFFISIIFCAIERTPFYLLNFVIAAITATIISKGYYLKVLKSHLNIMHFWFRNYRGRYMHQVYGDKARKMKPDFVSYLFKILYRVAPISLLGLNAWILSAFIFTILNGAENVMLYKMALWSIAFYVLAVLVLTVKRLTPIGEGYRYLEMTIVPTSILSSYIFFQLYDSSFRQFAIFALIFLLLFNLLSIVVIQIKGIVKDKNRSLTDNMSKLFSKINKLPGTPRIMCIPHQITTMVVYKTKAKVLVNLDAASFTQMEDFFPIFKKSVASVVKKYDISHIILREDFAKLSDLRFKKYKVIYQSGDVILVKTD